METGAKVKVGKEKVFQVVEEMKEKAELAEVRQAGKRCTISHLDTG